jgi:phage gpG-like protein
MHSETIMDKLAVTVKNESEEILYIDGDPNWDDQVLTINGTPQKEIYGLNPGGSSQAVVGVVGDSNEFGVIFATSRDSDSDGSGIYQLTIAPDDGGTLGVTDGGPSGHPTVNYTLDDRKPLSMTMRFVDDDNDDTLSLAVTVKNESSHEITIQGDPNWDDQVITIDGKAHKQPYSLAPSASVVVGIFDFNQIGVDFTSRHLNGDGDGDISYYMEIGPNDAGNQDVTDSATFGTPAVKYTLHDQEPLSMTMVFVDAS